MSSKILCSKCSHVVIDALKTIDYKGFQISVLRDEWPHNPRYDGLKDMDNYSHYMETYMISDYWDLDKPLFDTAGIEDWRWFAKFLIESGIAMASIPLYIKGDSWSEVREAREHETPTGVIYMPADKEYSIEAALDHMKFEISYFNSYWSGGGLGFIIHKGDEIFDSCWGFCARTIEDVIEEAKEQGDVEWEELC